MQASNGTVEAPPAPPSPVVVQGAAAPSGASPAAVYNALEEQAKVLKGQLEGALDQRSEEIAKLTNMSGNDFADARVGVQARIARLDKQIAGLEEQIQRVDAQTAVAAGVPGAVVPEMIDRGSNNEGEAFAGGMATASGILLVLFFIRRRFFSRGRRGNHNAMNLQLPAEISSRMDRLEGIAESTALEVERIGEGQRFVTKLLSEQQQKVPVK